MNDARLSPSRAAVRPGVKPKVYRRPASPAETERRREWGKRWGRLVQERYQQLLEGME